MPPQPRHPRLRRTALAVCVALAPAGLAAALMADNEPRNLVAHGDFESTAVSLRLPAVSPFPLVAGGWGARGADEGSVTVVGDAVEGRSAIQVLSRPESPTHLVQDVPLGTGSFILELSVRRMRGRQSVRLAGDWDRMDPAGALDLELDLAGAGIRLRTAGGAIDVAWPGGAREWTDVRLLADARNRQVQLWLDGVLSAAVPGRVLAPRTLVIGGHDDTASRFRYDRIELYRLAEVELAGIRRDVLRLVGDRDRPWIVDRLNAAATALERGDEGLAGPEVRAAARLLGRSTADGRDAPEEAALVRAIESLAELLAAS